MFNFNLLFDPLSLFFIFVICLISLPSAIYSLGYLKGFYHRPKIALAWALLIVFVLSMVFVVTAGNLLFFLVAWEVMSLASYFLVIFDTKHERSATAGAVYIVMTHAGTAFLIAAFLLLYRWTHSFDILAIKQACLIMPEQQKNILFFLLLIGFGTKAGIVPLHIWLPMAHPQAPSHISSIMSGVMIKTAIYGIIRFAMFTLGVNSSWWGILVLILAVISCLVGVIYALMEHDIKKLLAYHSVENIGIILLGVGLAMFFTSLNMPYLAVFSLIAGLYHLVNHAIFKGLLFLGAGSVYKSAGTRNMEKLGGLIKNMPQTAFCFLIGAMAISALPPLNGFVSEWLTLQAFFLGVFNLTGGIRLFMAICAAMLALTGGLAAACFVKAFGITFLALPRSRSAAEAKEAPLSMRIGMLFLAFAAVVFGLFCAPIMRLLARVAGNAMGIDISSMKFSLNNLTVYPQAGKNIYLGNPFLAIVLILLGVLAFIGYRMFSRRKPVINKVWDCGYYKLDARNEYTATAFSKPFRIAFSFFLMPYRKSQKIRESFYHVKTFAYETHTTKVFRKYFYDPALVLIMRCAKMMRRLQPGSIHLYLAYIFITVLLLIIFMGKF
ncbi:MAG: proton-conducting transporter membrane subunit [Candidatus Omnitrophica bacterium]|nr:proton-conducting transporter membrane subunit [Candidatus Omnitrophota bacterium]